MPSFLERDAAKEALKEAAQEQEENAGKLLEAANGVARTVNVRHLTFITLCVYIGLIIASTTHEMLLRISSVTLPLLNVEIPIKGFYAIASWFVVLFHLDLLLQFHMLSDKLRRFLRMLRSLPAEQAERLRERLV